MGLRKNQASLTSQEKQAFVNAVLAQKQKPSRLHPDAPDRSRYDDLVEVHLNAMNVMHGTPPVPSWGHMAAAFGPWHRVLLLEFELELQAFDPSVTIPYWDWTVDRSAADSLWKADFLGGNGSGADGRVSDGPFAGQQGQWKIVVMDAQGTPDFLTRRLGQHPTAPALPSAAQQHRVLSRLPYDIAPWDDMLRDDNDPAMWQGFRIGLEIALHNLVHRWVGGNMMDATSPNDPVFWLHHCNCDRLWSLWQFQHSGTAGYLPGGGGPIGHNLNDHMIFHEVGEPAPWNTVYRPRDVLDHRTLDVSYDSDPPDAPPITSPSVVVEPFEGRIAPPHRHRHALPMFTIPSEIAALRDLGLEP
jgi:tyrosinase